MKMPQYGYLDKNFNLIGLEQVTITDGHLQDVDSHNYFDGHLHDFYNFYKYKFVS